MGTGGATLRVWNQNRGGLVTAERETLEPPVESDHQRRQRPHAYGVEPAGPRVPDVRQHVLAGQGVGDGAERGDERLPSAQRDTPVLAEAQVRTEIRRHGGPADGFAGVMRASGELAAPVQQVARLPFEAARHHRGVAPKPPAYAEADGRARGGSDGDTAIEQLARADVGLVARP